MAEPLLLGRYHDAVTEALKKIGWVRDAGAYPERNVPRFSGLTTPAVYFSINSWEQGGGNEGQLSVNLTCDLFVVVDAAGSGVSQPEIFVRTAAADITQWIDGQQFGLGHIEPAVFTTAERDEFDPRMDDYLVWRISFTQAAAFGADQAINNLRTVFSSAVAEISGQLGNELAPDIRRLTDDLADWFKGGGVRRIVTFLRNDLYPGVLSFGQGVVFVGKIIYALAKKLSWLLPDDLNDQRDVLKTLAANGVERARFRASQNGQGEWFEQQLKDRPDLPEKVKRSWESTRGLFGFDSDDETFNKSLERYLSPEGGDTLLNWNTALQRNKGRSVQPPSDSSGGDIGYWDTLLQRMDNLDKQPPSRQVTDNRKFEYRFEINAAPGQDEKAIADEVTTMTKNNSAFNGDNSLLDGGLLW